MNTDVLSEDCPLSDTQDVPSFLCIVSPDLIRRQRMIRVIEQRLGTSPVRFKATQLNQEGVARIRDELSSLSLFSSSSFVLLEEIQDLKAAAMDPLLSLYDHIGPDSCFLLSGSGLPRSQKLKKFALSKESLFIFPVFASPKERKGFYQWIRKEFKRNGHGQVSRDVEEIIAQTSGGDLDHCATMIEQLCLYADREALTPALVTQLFGITHEGDIFNVIDAVLSGKRGEAILMIQELLRRNENAFQLLAVFSRTLAKILELKVLLMKKTPPMQAKKVIRIFNDRTYGRYVRLAKTRSLAQLQKNFNAILRADARLKNHSLGNDIVIYDLVDTLIQNR